MRCSRSEPGILGATLGNSGYSRSNSRNCTHDLSHEPWENEFLEQFSERLHELVGSQHFSSNSWSILFKIRVVPHASEFPKDTLEDVGCLVLLRIAWMFSETPELQVGADILSMQRPNRNGGSSVFASFPLLLFGRLGNLHHL